MMQKVYLLSLTKWKVMQRFVTRFFRTCESTTEQLHTVSTPCMDDQKKNQEEENKSVGKMSTVCSQIVLKCCVSGSYWDT